MSNYITFIDQCLRGAALPDQIDDYIEQWHEGQIGEGIELRELLGMSKREYAIWMRDASTINVIIAAKRQKRPIEDFTTDYYSMPLAARASDTGDAKKVTDWLRKLGKLD